MSIVELRYQPFNLAPYSRHREVKFPDTLSTLSFKQFVLLANLNEKTEENTFLSEFLGVPKRVTKRLSDNQRLYLFELFETYSDTAFMDKVIIDMFTFQDVTYIGPTDKLSNVTFGEFCFADTYFLDYNKKNDKMALNKFIATLYRPENKVNINAEDFDGDLRIRFNEHHIQKRAESFAAVYSPIPKAIVFNYIKLRAWLEVTYKFVFPKDTSSTKKKQQQPASWLPVLENIVGEDIINIERYTNVGLHTALRSLDNRIRDHYKSKPRG